MTATRPDTDATARPMPTTVVQAGVAVLASRGRLLLFVIVAAILVGLYTIVLPFGTTQEFSFANWTYLTVPQAALSVLLGITMAYVLVVQVHAVCQATAAHSSVAASGLALLGSVLPSMLVCGPLVPTVLAFVGLSLARMPGAVGNSMYFMTLHQTAFQAGSLVLLALTAWWGLRRIARGGCAHARDNETEGTPP